MYGLEDDEGKDFDHPYASSSEDDDEEMDDDDDEEMEVDEEGTDKKVTASAVCSIYDRYLSICVAKQFMHDQLNVNTR